MNRLPTIASPRSVKPRWQTKRQVKSLSETGGFIKDVVNGWLKGILLSILMCVVIGILIGTAMVAVGIYEELIHYSVFDLLNGISAR